MGEISPSSSGKIKLDDVLPGLIITILIIINFAAYHYVGFVRILYNFVTELLMEASGDCATTIGMAIIFYGTVFMIVSAIFCLPLCLIIVLITPLFKQHRGATSKK